MPTALENIISAITPFILGINFFLALYFILYGGIKKIRFHMVMGSVLLIFSSAFIQLIRVQKKYIYLDIDTLAFAIVFLYTVYLTKTTIKKRYYIVFIPGIIQVYMVCNSLFSIQEFSTSFYRIFSLSNTIYTTILILYCLKKLHHISNTIENYYVIRESYKGIKLILYITLVFNIVWMVNEFIITSLPSISWVIDAIMIFCSFIVILYVGYWTLEKREREATYSIIEKDLKKQYPSSTDTNFTPVASLYDTLLNIIERDELYLNSDITLKDIAFILGEKEKIVSKTIRHFSKDTFYIFINNYRIAYFKTLLLDHKQKDISIDGLIEMSGFKSKSTFYSHFKRIEGVTPSQYLKNQV